MESVHEGETRHRPDRRGPRSAPPRGRGHGDRRSPGPTAVGRDEVQQLAGYLLLDYDDRYHIREVGLYLARQGALIRWTVPEVLTMLGAHLPLPQLRGALRGHLQGSHPA
ncbi:hypothetical protein ABZT03_38680 [Streptomyces sp. NPDC005574]|uniref:hypothetical protein n=1 Tax=Streptomyces sp. NPDC005574 TaxID=3156891 RepID=UPI0033A30D63